MRKLLVTSIILLSKISYSQITFEKSYFITNSNEKVECLIKNKDWQNNPESFEYKLAEDSEIKNGHIDTVKEFKIYDGAHYIRYNTNIDRSNQYSSLTTTNKKPVFKKETLFLKVLVSGDANLLAYQNGNFKRFFYRNKQSETAEQLVYKSYLIGDTHIAYNNRFRQQLLNRLACKTIEPKTFENLKYTKTALTYVFNKYNKCIDPNYSNSQKPEKKGRFSLAITPGINFSNLELQNVASDILNPSFKTKASFRLGLEVEYILPVNKNKWSIFTEPTYQYFKAVKNLSVSSKSYNVEVNYKSIEIPFGIRHKFFLNENSLFFTNVSIIYDFGLNSKVKFSDSFTLKLRGKYNFAFGAGYKFKRYSIEARYHTNRHVAYNYVYWRSNYKVTSLIFGYTLF